MSEQYFTELNGYLVKDSGARQLIDKRHTFSCSELGMLTTNTEQTAIDNFNILKSSLEKGINVIIDDSYYVKNSDVANSIIPTKDIFIQGLNNDCNLKTFDNEYFYMIKPNNFNIHLDNFNFINTYSKESLLIYEENNLEQKQYGNITIENSYFDGNIGIFDIKSDESVEKNETWGINNILFKNNIVENNFFRASRLVNTPYGVVDIIGNTIHNFKYCFLRAYPSNNEGPATGSQYLKCINACENNVYNDDDIFTDDGTYACFIETKSNTAIIRNNTIKGIKSNNREIGVYSCYLSCLNVIFENNICENIINFGGNDYNYCMKAKNGVGYRLYRNNKFILNKDWVLSINSNFDTPYSEADLLENTTISLFHSETEQIEWKIEDNYFDLIKIYNYQSSRDIHYCYFNNNIVNCEEITGRLFRPTSNTKVVECCNNTINISKTNSTGGASLCFLTDVTTSCDIKINDNKIYGKPLLFELLSLEETGVVNNIELLNNNYFLKTESDAASYSRLVLIRGKYNNLKVDGYYNFINALNINRVKISPNKMYIDEKIVFGTFTANQETFDIDKNQEYNGRYLMKLEYYNDSNEKITQESIFELAKENDIQYIKFTDNSNNDVVQDITTPPAETILKDLKNYSGATSNIQFRYTTSVLYLRLNSISLSKNKMMKIHFEKIA